MAPETSGVSGGRAEGNAKFKEGDLAGAVTAYEACLTDPDEDRLPVLSNLGLCYLKLNEHALAVARLREALSLTRSLFAAPKLASKAAARLYEAYGASESTAKRQALFDLRFYMNKDGGKLTGVQTLPTPADEKAVLKAIVTMVNAPHNAHGLAAVRAAMVGVPADACDQHGGCLLVVAAEVACKSSGRGAQSYGCELLALMLEGSTPPDVRNTNGATPLMTVANKGRADLCTMLLEAGASVSATDHRGFLPLHCACAGMEDMLGREQEYAAVFAQLLDHGASPSQVNDEGMTPLMYCGQRLHGQLSSATQFVEMLLAAGADLTRRTSCKALHGYSAVDYALIHGDQTPTMALLRQAAEARGAQMVAWITEAVKIDRWVTFVDDRIVPAHQAGTDALMAAGVPFGTVYSGANDCPVKGRAAILQEVGKAAAIVGAFVGLPSEEMFDVIDNPLLKAHTGLLAVVPTVVTKRWDSQQGLTDHERGEIQRLWGQHEQQREFLTIGPSTNRMQPFFVAKKLHQDWILHFQMPLQHTYACAIPNEAAIDAIASLRTPVLELGAGAGYWGALLRLRGVECVLYDRAPPTEAGNNPYFGRQYTEVLAGDESKAGLYPGHALVLVWPYSDEEAESIVVPDSDPWDVRALRQYQGSTVVHVGELDELAHNRTTSRAFKQLLTSAFTQVMATPLPSWPHCDDTLTIWKRRSGATAA